MVATAPIIVTLLLSFAAKKPPRSSGGGGGFGSPKKPNNKKPRSTGPRPSPAGSSSLEAKLLQQHSENCRASAAKWATVDGSCDAGAYNGGWHELAPSPPIAPNANEPYGTSRLILKSREPLLSEDECDALIDQMEAHGAANGWDARYPVQGFTREVNIADIPESVELLNGALKRTLLPAVASEFEAFNASTLRVNEALVVKYDAASGNNCLPVHEDFSYVTVNVALTDSSRFTGGGTWFQHADEIVVADRGEVVMHAGAVPHCGVPVASGERYQLVLFILTDKHPDLPGRLKAIGAAAGAKAASALMDVKLSTTALERSVQLNPMDTEAWNQLGHNKRHDGDLEAAADAFERIGKLSGQRDFAALCSLAAVRSSQSDHGAALEALTRAIDIGAPPSPSMAVEMLSTQHNVGMELMALGRHEDAGLVLEGVIEADPDASDSWAALGVCMAELGQPEAALACQKQVISIKAAKGPSADR